MNSPKFEIFKEGQWYRWRLLGANGAQLARSGERYARLNTAQGGIRVFTNIIQNAESIPTRIIKSIDAAT
jgi:uncharacterized protein YegP (UPF0339 family)